MRKRRRPTTMLLSEARPFCFVSYSTREPHVGLLLECAKMLFSPHYGVELTPSALASGASQRDQITQFLNKEKLRFPQRTKLRLSAAASLKASRGCSTRCTSLPRLITHFLSRLQTPLNDLFGPVENVQQSARLLTNCGLVVRL